MFPKRMMIIGAVFMAAAAALLVVALFMIGEEQELVKKAVPYEGGASAAVRQGELVIAGGKVSEKNKVLIFHFVDAAKENNDAGTWLIMETYRQPVIADLARGEIILNSETVCTRPEGKNVVNTNDRTPNNDPIRYEGLRRGDPITAIGTLTSLKPATLAVKHWYSGSIADYKNSMVSNRKSGYIGSALVFLLGAGLVVWGWKKR